MTRSLAEAREQREKMPSKRHRRSMRQVVATRQGIQFLEPGTRGAMIPGRHVPAGQARNHFCRLLDDAAHGRATVITRRGRPVAALMPLAYRGSSKQKSLLDLAGSGRGLWGRSSSETMAKLRKEWNR